LPSKRQAEDMPNDFVKRRLYRSIGKELKVLRRPDLDLCYSATVSGELLVLLSWTQLLLCGPETTCFGPQSNKKHQEYSATGEMTS